MNSPCLGILGGMGPYATVDFTTKLLQTAGNIEEQEHIPFILNCDPRIPNRSSAIMGEGPSPFPALLDAASRLCRSGALAIAIPCNTAHIWLPELVEEIPVLFFDMVKLAALAATKSGVSQVAVLATSGTVHTGLYTHALKKLGADAIYPSPKVQSRVDMGIAEAKRGHLHRAGELLTEGLQSFEALGIEQTILGCTEIALSLETKVKSISANLTDSNTELAKACVAWWRSLKAQRYGSCDTVSFDTDFRCATRRQCTCG